MSAVTAFQQVAEALAAALLASPALAGGHVKANPTRPFAREVAAAIGVRLVRARQTGGTNCGLMWQCEYAADVEARGDSGGDPADAVDALLSAVAGRWAALDLSALGVAQALPDSDVEWEFDAADTPLAKATYSLSLAVCTTDALGVPT